MKIYIRRLDSFTDEEFSEYYSMLSEKRKSAIDRLRNVNDKRRSLLGEAMVRRLISAKFSVNEKDIHFERTEKGKPFCLNFDIKFGISHSKELIAVAIGENDIGIDIERIRKIEPRITKIACTESDKEFVFQDNNRESFDNDSKKRFFELWTAKEAYFKFCGTGIIKLQEVNYRDIEKNITCFEIDDYILSIYSESDKCNHEIVFLN